MLEVKNLTMSYGSGPNIAPVISDLSLEVHENEFLCVVGPSGCGKSTLLKGMSGLMEPAGGEVRLKDAKVSGPPKGMAMVFQEYGRSLMPWMTARGNVEMPLIAKGIGKNERQELVEDALDSMGLLHAIDKYPWQLSGGMQQRVAIARALAYRPDILLMDEPFAAVDAQTRNELEDLMLHVRERYRMTTLFVTHDVDESVYLADRVVILSKAPTSVLEELDVPLPKPRDQVETKSLSEFTRLRTQVFQAIQSQSTKTQSIPTV